MILTSQHIGLLTRQELWHWRGPKILARESAVDEAESLQAYVNNLPQASELYYFQTSGSEGRPKWVGLSKEAIMVSANAVNQHLESSVKDRWLISLPFYHVGGFSILARCHLSGASFVHRPDKWDAGQFAELCHREQVTLISLVPTQIFDLVQQKLEAPASLRAIVVGGGALDMNQGRAAQALGWPVLQSYGMTETASQIATAPLEQLYQGFDPDCMEVLSPWQLSTEEDGRLVVQGAALAEGYAVLSDDGKWAWQPLNGELRTRDFVSVWLHGTRKFLQVKGRESSFVKVKGELINIAAIQKKLDEIMPGCVICPMPDKRRGASLVLVYKEGRFTDDQIEDLWQQYHLKADAAERLHERQSVAEIPRSPLGKVQLRELRELLG